MAGRAPLLALHGAFSRGGLAHDKVIRSMRLFAEKVIPKVR